MKETKIVTVHTSVSATMIADLERLIEALKDGYSVRQMLSFPFPYNVEYHLDRYRETKSEAIERFGKMSFDELATELGHYKHIGWEILLKSVFHYLSSLPD